MRRQEVLIEQFKKAGMRLRFTNGTIPETSANFFGPKRRATACSPPGPAGRIPSLSYSLMFLQGRLLQSGPRRGLARNYSGDQLPAGKSEDLEGRREAFAKVQRLVMENALFAPLAFQFELDAYSTKVKGYKPNLLGKPKFEEVWLES